MVKKQASTIDLLAASRVFDSSPFFVVTLQALHLLLSNKLYTQYLVTPALLTMEQDVKPEKFYINKNAELYIFTKSPKLDHIFKLCLHMLEENNC